MSRPILLCARGEEPGLRHHLPDYEIVVVDSKRSGLKALSAAARDGRDAAIVTRDGPTTVGSDWNLAVELLLERARLRRRIQETNDNLSLVSQVGVGLAESFDIREILALTHEAVSHILGQRPVEIAYAGSEAIHALSCWYPAEPGEGHLTAAERERVMERLVSLSRSGESARHSEASTTAETETFASLHAGSFSSAGRGVLPLAHRDGLFGLLLFSLPGDVPSDRLELASVLTHQAATALRNIHLTQERIHFERLSTVGRMVGSIVHDFRSPLTALRGYAGMSGELDTTAEERREYTAAIKEECDRLEHMVDELLELTRARQAPVERRPLEIARFVEEFVRGVRHRFEASLRVECEVGLAATLYVALDRKRMERALWNVVTNAFQAMSGRGLIRIRARQCDQKIHLEIEDAGPGIPPEIRHRIFEPFFSYGKSEGIGLGMATALRVAEEHDGDIEILSEKGRGTTIRFVLPLEPAKRAEADRKTETETVGANAERPARPSRL